MRPLANYFICSVFVQLIPVCLAGGRGDFVSKVLGYLQDLALVWPVGNVLVAKAHRRIAYAALSGGTPPPGVPVSPVPGGGDAHRSPASGSPIAGAGAAVPTPPPPTPAVAPASGSSASGSGGVSAPSLVPTSMDDLISMAVARMMRGKPRDTGAAAAAAAAGEVNIVDMLPRTGVSAIIPGLLPAARATSVSTPTSMLGTSDVTGNTMDTHSSTVSAWLESLAPLDGSAGLSLTPAMESMNARGLNSLSPRSIDLPGGRALTPLDQLAEVSEQLAELPTDDADDAQAADVGYAAGGRPGGSRSRGGRGGTSRASVAGVASVLSSLAAGGSASPSSRARGVPTAQSSAHGSGPGGSGSGGGVGDTGALAAADRHLNMGAGVPSLAQYPSSLGVIGAPALPLGVATAGPPAGGGGSGASGGTVGTGVNTVGSAAGASASSSAAAATTAVATTAAILASAASKVLSGTGATNLAVSPYLGEFSDARISLPRPSVRFPRLFAAQCRTACAVGRRRSESLQSLGSLGAEVGPGLGAGGGTRATGFPPTPTAVAGGSGGGGARDQNLDFLLFPLPHESEFDFAFPFAGDSPLPPPMLPLSGVGSGRHAGDDKHSGMGITVGASQPAGHAGEGAGGEGGGVGGGGGATGK